MKIPESILHVKDGKISSEQFFKGDDKMTDAGLEKMADELRAEIDSFNSTIDNEVFSKGKFLDEPGRLHRNKCINELIFRFARTVRSSVQLPSWEQLTEALPLVHYDELASIRWAYNWLRSQLKTVPLPNVSTPVITKNEHCEECGGILNKDPGYPWPSKLCKCTVQPISDEDIWLNRQCPNAKTYQDFYLAGFHRGKIASGK